MYPVTVLPVSPRAHSNPVGCHLCIAILLYMNGRKYHSRCYMSGPEGQKDHIFMICEKIKYQIYDRLSTPLYRRTKLRAAIFGLVQSALDPAVHWIDLVRHSQHEESPILLNPHAQLLLGCFCDYFFCILAILCDGLWIFFKAFQDVLRVLSFN